jgi:hypothetical protein
MKRNQISDKQRSLAMQASNGKCVYCSMPADTIDHVIPVFAGGRTESDNLVASCMLCNRVAGKRSFSSILNKRVYILSWYLCSKLYFENCSFRKSIAKKVLRKLIKKYPYEINTDTAVAAFEAMLTCNY